MSFFLKKLSNPSPPLSLPFPSPHTTRRPRRALLLDLTSQSSKNSNPCGCYVFRYGKRNPSLPRASATKPCTPSRGQDYAFPVNGKLRYAISALSSIIGELGFLNPYQTRGQVSGWLPPRGAAPDKAEISTWNTQGQIGDTCAD